MLSFEWADGLLRMALTQLLLGSDGAPSNDSDSFPSNGFDSVPSNIPCPNTNRRVFIEMSIEESFATPIKRSCPCQSRDTVNMHVEAALT